MPPWPLRTLDHACRSAWHRRLQIRRGDEMLRGSCAPPGLAGGALYTTVKSKRSIYVGDVRRCIAVLCFVSVMCIINKAVAASA